MNTIKNLRNQFAEVLTRGQLKNIVGGDMPVDPMAKCDCPNKPDVCGGTPKCAVSNNKYHCGDETWHDCPVE